MARGSFLALFAAVLAYSVYAQQPSAPAHKTMLLIGCVQTVPESQTFKLVGTTLEAPGAGVPGSAAQPKPIGTSGKGGEYELTTDNSIGRSGAEPVDLRMYAGHRVQITARSPEPAYDSSSNAVSPNSTVEKKTTSEEQKPQRLIVVDIKELSMTCQ